MLCTDSNANPHGHGFSEIQVLGFLLALEFDLLQTNLISLSSPRLGWVGLGRLR